MKKPLILIFVFILVSMSITFLNCSEKDNKITLEDDTVSIQALVAEWGTAVEAGNIEKVMNLYSDDIVRMPPDAPIIKGKKAIKEVYQGGFELFSFEVNWPVEGTEDIIVTDGWAIYLSEYIEWFTPKAGGDKIEERGKIIEILQKQTDNSWKIAREIWNRNSPRDSN